MKEQRKTFAGRLTRRILLWLFVILGGLSYLIFYFTKFGTDEFYGASYHNGMIVTREYIRRVLSDVYVAIANNAYYLEKSLDKPDLLKADMERIVKNNSRIKSCGLSFIDSYYPKKGRQFCPYAWRDSTDWQVIKSLDMGEADIDYLDSRWFLDVVEKDSAHWSDPFFDGYDSKMPLVSYILPIHDAKGSVVGVLGADISLDWLTQRLVETDSATNKKMLFGGNGTYLGSHSFIIRRDGTYITHVKEGTILRDNFFNHIASYDESDVEALVGNIKDGKESIDETDELFLIDGKKYYVFYAPVKFSGWTLVTVVRRLSIDLSGIFMGLVLLCFMAVAMVTIVIVCFFAIRRAAKPLHTLASSADEVAKGHFDTPLPQVKYNDEIRLLRDSFDNMQHSLVKYIDNLRETTASKAAIVNELDIAHKIQMTMLPKTFPPYPERRDIDIFGTVTPAKAVGGDLFDFFIRNEQLFFCIGDVSGKGIPASLVMAVTRSSFRYISTHTAQPSHIVSALNDVLSVDNDTNMFVTLFVGVLNLGNGKLLYCNAGHDAPLLVGKKVTKLLVESNLPIGVMPNWNFVSQETIISPNTTIFLYTDGLNEAENIGHELFGEERMLAVAQETANGHSLMAETLIANMTTAVHAFVGEAEQSDDLTMLAIRLKNTEQTNN